MSSLIKRSSKQIFKEGCDRNKAQHPTPCRDFIETTMEEQMNGGREGGTKRVKGKEGVFQISTRQIASLFSF